MSIAYSPLAKSRQVTGAAEGRALGLAERREQKVRGLASAIAWRERRRCSQCGALAYHACAHRPHGFGSIAPELREEWPLS